MDVLTYSAYNENRRVEAAIAQAGTDLATACAATASAQTASLPYSDDAICWLKCVEPCLIRCPHHTALWTKIPSFTPGSILRSMFAPLIQRMLNSTKASVACGLCQLVHHW